MNSTAPHAATGRSPAPHRLNRLMQRSEFGLIIANIVVFLTVLVFDPAHNFKSSASLQLLLTETTMLSIFAIGSTVVIIAGGIDLSVGSVIAFSGIVFTLVLRGLAPEAIQAKSAVGGFVLAVGMAAALASCLAVGVLHAGLITRLGLPPFVATLGTLIGLRSLGRVLAQHWCRSDKIAVAAPDFRALYNATLLVDATPFGFQVAVRWAPLLVFLAVVCGVGLLMRRTVVGRHLYALGGNEQAARLSGIRTDRLKYLAYCLGALLGGAAGILYAAREGQGNSQTMAAGYELNAIAAAVVGGCSLRGGAGTVLGTVLGALFLTLVINGIPHLVKVDSSLYEGMIVGVVVILAVAVNQFRPAAR